MSPQLPVIKLIAHNKGQLTKNIMLQSRKMNLKTGASQFKTDPETKQRPLETVVITFEIDLN